MHRELPHTADNSTHPVNLKDKHLVHCVHKKKKTMAGQAAANPRMSGYEEIVRMVN